MLCCYDSSNLSAESGATSDFNERCYHIVKNNLVVIPIR